MYPGNKLRGNRDCEIIIRWAGIGFKREGGQCLNYSVQTGGGHIIFNNNLSYAQQDLNSILGFVIAIRCLKFNQVAAKIKSCFKWQKVARTLL